MQFRLVQTEMIDLLVVKNGGLEQLRRAIMFSGLVAEAGIAAKR